ncbi:MAG: transposase [Caldilineaceae bacterium]|nr:transposase [Caldilineaceae bacterium]
MWDGYLNAIEEYIQAHEDVTAYQVVNRFHVAENYWDDFDSLRKTEMKRLKKGLPEETYEQECKGMLWTLRKNHEDLEDDDRKRLCQLFRHTPLLHQAYTLRTELTAIFNQAKTIDEAEHRLNRWMQKVEQLDVACFRPFIKTLASARHRRSSSVSGLTWLGTKVSCPMALLPCQPHESRKSLKYSPLTRQSTEFSCSDRTQRTTWYSGIPDSRPG